VLCNFLLQSSTSLPHVLQPFFLNGCLLFSSPFVIR
jgi:hypothetical protein